MIPEMAYMPPHQPEMGQHEPYVRSGGVGIVGFIILYPQPNPLLAKSPILGGTKNVPAGALGAANTELSPWRYGVTSNTVDGVSSEGTAGPATAPKMLADVKLRLGWTWEQLAAVLNCSRQAVYVWTQGGEIKPDNLERLARLSATIKFVDRGIAEDNRALLLSPTPDGRILLDLLSAGEFEAVRNIAGNGSGRPTAGWTAVREVSHDHDWFGRLAENSGVEADIVFAPSPERNRRAVRRR